MNTDTVDTGSARPSFWTGRSGLVVALFLLGLAVFLTHGTITMEVPPNVSSPGPRFFPVIVTGLTYLLAGAMALQVIRFPSQPGPAPETPVEELMHVEQDMAAESASSVVSSEAATTDSTPAAQGDSAKADTDYRTYTDWRAVGIVVAAFIAFTVLLTPLGWLISGALLFWGVSYALDGRRPLFDVSVALLVSAVVQLAFSGGLGLNLPSGILGGIF